MPSFQQLLRLSVLCTFATAKTIWKPSQGAKWDIYLQNTYKSDNTGIAVVDVDLFANDANNIAKLKQKGSKVICYFSAGTYENWRTDWKATPNQLGKALPDWPGENWCDVRLQSVRDVMIKRIELAESRGCDAIDPDNMDGYANDNGIKLTEADLKDYAKFLADAGHSRGLAVGLKNALSIVDDLTDTVDFAVNEQCHQYKECNAYSGFVAAGKNVFQIEYPKGDDINNNKNVSKSTMKAICQDPSAKKFSPVIKNMNVDTFRQYCDT